MNRSCRYIWLLLAAFAGSLTAAAQTSRIDSLHAQIVSARGDDQQLKAIIGLCNEYKSLNRDTLDLYAYLAQDLAAKTRDQSLKQGAALALAYDYARWGWHDSALVAVEPLIRQNRITDPAGRDLYYKASRLKAMSFATHGRYQEGLTILYQLVSLAEAYNDTLTLAENFNSIASIALARSQPADAFTWTKRALSLRTHADSFTPIEAAIYVNMADAFHQLGKTDSANDFIEKGIALFRQTNILSNLSLALQRQSNILIDAGKLDRAEAALKEMTAIRKRLGDADMVQDENLTLVNFYIQTGQLKKAILTCKALLKTGDLRNAGSSGSVSFSNSVNIRLGYYEALARCYKLSGEMDLYRQTLEAIISAKDSSYQYNSAKAIAELQTKYEVQRKENTIIQQQLDITKKNTRFYTLLGGAFFLAIIAAILFTGYRKREKIKLNVLLEKEKDEAERSVVRAEENERKRIAADLHDNLGAHAASIVSNLDLIELSPPKASGTTAIRELRNNSLAIVAQLNDTIWALKKDMLSLTTLSDRIKVFIQRIEPSYPAISMRVVEEIEIGEDPLLSPSHALHLFRIVQEAINNAVRHSRAKEVVVTLKSGVQQWMIEVSDDGIGIDGQRADGNGLANMKERAEKAGWSILWVAGGTVGTSVVISSK